MGFAQCEHILLLLVLDDQLQEVGKRTVCKEYLTFAVDDILLQIECNCLSLADVLHCFGHGDAGLLADVEEAIDRSTTCEDYSGVCQNLYALSPELFEAHALNAVEGVVIDIYLMLAYNFEER